MIQVKNKNNQKTCSKKKKESQGNRLKKLQKKSKLT